MATRTGTTEGGKRVLVAGIGGELGSLTASLFENEPWVGPVMGIDVDPPRRRLRRAEVHLIDPTDRDRIVDEVTRFNPHVMIHLAVWEPDARAGTAVATRFTHSATTAILGAAAECPAMETVVVRSGIEIYGRRSGSPTRPDESTRLDPTSEYGRTLFDLEQTATSVGERVGLSVARLRLASVVGPHVPSPLGRLLRQPAVPFSALSDSPFTLVEDAHAARAFVAAARAQYAGALNVVSPGAITVYQALRRGRRLPLPLLGPEWFIARQISHLFGAPIPDHVMEVMHRGRLANGQRLQQE
ncbi:MAG TPA: NAD-dependent epimerase/dehydratase family protein, partial [Ilumatobacteraceae bacterium]|nr:NAD-dependent epimerase/dehydratase family protein [Ilumatobacteraceae bacterium]